MPTMLIILWLRSCGLFLLQIFREDKKLFDHREKLFFLESIWHFIYFVKALCQNQVTLFPVWSGDKHPPSHSKAKQSIEVVGAAHIKWNWGWSCIIHQTHFITWKYKQKDWLSIAMQATVVVPCFLSSECKICSGHLLVLENKVSTPFHYLLFHNLLGKIQGSNVLTECITNLQKDEPKHCRWLVGHHCHHCHLQHKLSTEYLHSSWGWIGHKHHQTTSDKCSSSTAHPHQRELWRFQCWSHTCEKNIRHFASKTKASCWYKVPSWKSFDGSENYPHLSSLNQTCLDMPLTFREMWVWSIFACFCSLLQTITFS